jgi:hypothetical protein
MAAGVSRPPRSQAEEAAQGFAGGILVGFEVVADHGDTLHRQVELARHGMKQLAAGFADQASLLAGGVLECHNERPGVE